MKYIIAEINSCEVAILFPESIYHSIFKSLNPISAGFCRIVQKDSQNADPLIVEVWGKSKGLNLQHRKDDEEIIRHSIEFRA